MEPQTKPRIPTRPSFRRPNPPTPPVQVPANVIDVDDAWFDDLPVVTPAVAKERSNEPSKPRAVKTKTTPVRVNRQAVTSSKRENVLSAPLDVYGKAQDSTDGKPDTSGRAFDAVPNALFRSALFGCAFTKGKERLLVNNQTIFSTGQYKIQYSGETLNAADAEVFMLCCAAVRAGGGLDRVVEISLREWNARLGKKASGTNNTWLKASLERLVKGTVTVTRYGSKSNASADREIVMQVAHVRFLDTYQTTVIRDGDNEIHRICIGLDTRIIPLFGVDATEIDLDRVSKLPRTLDKWLHNFYSTHSKPIDIKLADLKEWSGTPDSMPMFAFRDCVRKAVVALTECDPPLFAKGTVICRENDVLQVVKASNSRVIGPAPAKSNVLASAVATPSRKPGHLSEVEKARMQRSRVAL